MILWTSFVRAPVIWISTNHRLPHLAAMDDNMCPELYDLLSNMSIDFLSWWGVNMSYSFDTVWAQWNCHIGIPRYVFWACALDLHMKKKLKKILSRVSTKKNLACLQFTNVASWIYAGKQLMAENSASCLQFFLHYRVCIYGMGCEHTGLMTLYICGKFLQGQVISTLYSIFTGYYTFWHTWWRCSYHPLWYTNFCEMP